MPTESEKNLPFFYQNRSSGRFFSATKYLKTDLYLNLEHSDLPTF